MATFTKMVGWFLIACGIAAFIVPLVIRVPDPEGERSVWSRARDAATLVGLGLVTLFFPLRVHVMVVFTTLAGGWCLKRSRIARSQRDR